MGQLGVALLAALLALCVQLEYSIADDAESKVTQVLVPTDEPEGRGYQNWLSSIDELSNKYSDTKNKDKYTESNKNKNKDKYADSNKDKYADINKDKNKDKYADNNKDKYGDMNKDKNKDKYVDTNKDKYTESSKDKNKDKYTDSYRDKNKDKYSDSNKDKNTDKNADRYKDKYDGSSFSFSVESFERPSRPSKPNRPSRPHESSQEHGRPQRPQKPWERPPSRPQRPPKDSVSESEEYEVPFRPPKPSRPHPPHNFLLDDPYYSTCCIDIQSSLVNAMGSLDNIAVSINAQMEGIAADMKIVRNITAQQDVIAESIRTNSFKGNIISNEIQAEATVINQMVSLLVEAAYALGFAFSL